MWFVYTLDEWGFYDVVVVLLFVDWFLILVFCDGGELLRWLLWGDGFFYRDGQCWYWVELMGLSEWSFVDLVFCCCW